MRQLAEKNCGSPSTRGARHGARFQSPTPLAFSGGYRGDLFRQADVICIVGLRATYLEEWFEAPEWRRDVKYIQIQERHEEAWIGLPTVAACIGSTGKVLRQMHELAGKLPANAEREIWLEALRDARNRFKQRQQTAVDKWRKSDRELVHRTCWGHRSRKSSTIARR